MNIVNTLKSKGYHLKHEGNGNYRVKGYGGLIVKHDCWYSHSDGKGGGFTTLMARLQEKYDRNASYKSVKTTPRCVRKKELSTSHLTRLGFRGRQYLLTRGIDGTFIDELSEKALVLEDPIGYVAFIGYDENEKARCISNRAYRDSLTVQRYETKGSDKRYSFSVPSRHAKAHYYTICEGPIDALSLACLDRLFGESNIHTTRIATCGAPSSILFERIKMAKPATVFLSFDNDEPGLEMTRRTKHMLGRLPVKVVVASPHPYCKDPNDMLRMVRGMP